MANAESLAESLWVAQPPVQPRHLRVVTPTPEPGPPAVSIDDRVTAWHEEHFAGPVEKRALSRLVGQTINNFAIRPLERRRYSDSSYQESELLFSGLCLTLEVKGNSLCRSSTELAEWLVGGSYQKGWDQLSAFEQQLLAEAANITESPSGQREVLPPLPPEIFLG